MSRVVTIKIVEVKGFCCSAIVRDRKSRHKLAETRDYPYGFDASAYEGAVGIATERGWRVWTRDDAEGLS